MKINEINDLEVYGWALEEAPADRAAFVRGALLMREKVLHVVDRKLGELAARFLSDGRGEVYYERMTEPSHDFDGRVVLEAQYKKVTREHIEQYYGERIFRWIPVIPAGWELTGQLHPSMK